MPLVIKTGKDPDAAIGEAAQVILKGGIVAVPTESFYGLAVDATNERAIKRLLEIKKRPPDNPILILVSSIRALEKHVRGISTTAQ
ncbi:MAG: Sua5/YciO/YrdC/YwlC family protein, partial [Deltaproteobacteria bacterium]|nr:Sua5/YciO/YrdC/YwlC family protein [Deltaproteobacteria bacterium]